MPTYSGDVSKDNKPKLTPIKAIKKFIISYGIKLEKSPPIYYAWEQKRQPKWYEEGDNVYPDEPY